MTELFNQYNYIEKSNNVEIEQIDIDISNKFDYAFNGVNRFKGFNTPEIDKNFNLGLVVGPSGSGKSTILNTFGEPSNIEWKDNKSVASHFKSADEAINKLSSVGLSSVPDWFKSYNILSNGEKFRANLARSLEDNKVIDEFSSVIDRNVAKACSLSFSKYIFKNNIRNIVLASCHYDIIEWLLPDWCFDTLKGELSFPRGLLQRPEIRLNIYTLRSSDEVQKVWSIFKKHHYLTDDISSSCTAWIAYWNDELVAFNSVLPQPGIVGKKHLWREHRLVVLPEFQGLGIGIRFSESIGDILHKQGKLFVSKTTHPKLGQYRNRSSKWQATTSNEKIASEHGGNLKSSNVRKVPCFSHYYKGESND